MAKNSKPEMVRVYNKAERSIKHEVVDPETKKVTTYHLKPQSFGEVPEDIAEKWKDMFPDHVVDAESAERSLGGVRAELEMAQDQIKELEAQVEKLIADNADLKAKLKAASV